MRLKLRLQEATVWPLFAICVVSCVMVASCEKPLEGEQYMPVYPTIDCNPEWSPDGSTIVFFHRYYDSAWNEIPDSSGLWFISPDGTDMRLLTSALGGQMRWSPDGLWLLFDGAHQIWKVNVASESITLVLSDSGGRNHSPTWSPDGKRIAFDRFQEDGRTGIYTMAADGSDLRYIGYGAVPDWSPDGEHIAYTGLELLAVKDTNGGNDRKLVTTDDVTGGPAFSPDGSEIAFAAAMGGEGGIYLIDASGGHLRLLVRDAACPSWSPDGRRIVYVGLIYERSRPDGFLYVVNADGSGRKRLTFGPGH
jgi:Tol biopolymer transport system component